ncbi:hypothetical protein KAW38_01985 [Candidatus Micrarchaeota archaeon]|nr:hypothetical protein [Candidatus Micrarchaeota archaeon]
MKKLKKPAEKGRRFRKLKWFAKKSLRMAGIAYLTAFLTLSTHVGYHYFKHRKPEIEQGMTINELEINGYKVNINGKEKYLTLVGETHMYTKKEYEIAKKLIEEHKYFACEVGIGFRKNTSTKNYIYGWIYRGFFDTSYLYYRLGSGRWYKPLAHTAKNNYNIYPLEGSNDFFDNLSFKEKMLLFSEFTLSLLISPFQYYNTIGEIPNENEYEYDFGELQEPVIDKRDRVMAKSIVELLERDEIDKLLAEIGSAHLKGVTENLSQEVELEKIQE